MHAYDGDIHAHDSKCFLYKSRVTESAPFLDTTDFIEEACQMRTIRHCVFENVTLMRLTLKPPHALDEAISNTSHNQKRRTNVYFVNITSHMSSHINSIEKDTYVRQVTTGQWPFQDQPFRF